MRLTKTNGFGLVIFFLTVGMASCRNTREVDLLIFNARIYTVDSLFTIAEAMAVKDKKIIEIGSSGDITQKYYSSNKINAEGRTIYPGFIDAHAHFYQYGVGLVRADLNGTRSWKHVLQVLDSFARKNPEGWLIGRGWDHNDWPEKVFPSKEALDSIFPQRPVLLTRVDGHAAIANETALRAARITPGMRVNGGEVETRNGKLTGILVDNAVDLVSNIIPAPTPEGARKALDEAQKKCFAAGLTSVTDCGLDHTQVQTIDSLQKKGELKMRVYAMLSDAPKNYNFLFEKGKIKNDVLHVRAFKLYADGALGSRGACLLQPYNDRAGWYGFLLSPLTHFDSVAKVLYEKDYQMCTHAIGDSGNRAILDIYGRYLKGKNDRRWRIEHAQVVNKADFSRFGQFSIIPSVQPTHATSDMYWADERLGSEREKGAYAYRDLMQQNGWIPLGTDFPVEDISPFKTFYAAVFRTDAASFPKGGYQMANALTREDALRGMTIWAARAQFEESEKGSLEKGKWADFVVMDLDLMKAKPAEVLSATVLATFIGGERVHGQ